MVKQDEARRLAVAKLASSGLTTDDAGELGCEVVASARTLDPTWPEVPALVLRYHDLKGKLRADVVRARVLAAPVNAFGVADLKTRYLQPKGTVPGAYLPRTVDWAGVASNPGVDLFITEGELKAACACKHGFTTIGLGGVWSWRTAKLGWPLLPELEAFAWSGRVVTILYDSDAFTNADVAAATSALVEALAQRGALPKVARLPDAEGRSKTGLDDLIVAEGPEALHAVIDAAQADELARELWRFNRRFCYVLNPGFVHDQDLRHAYEPGKFKANHLANVQAVQTVIGADGGVKLVETSVAEAWVRWPLRRQVARVTYEPGQAGVVSDRLNVWEGWGVEPRKGPVTLWDELLDHLFLGEDDLRAWFEAWCLYPLRHPGAKLPTAACLWSRRQGLGKSVVGKLLGRVYGANYSEVSQRELESQFNGWHVYRQFVMFDDVSAYDSRAKADVLKKMVTEEEVLVNTKGIPTYGVPDRANFYLTSNKPNALYLEDEDRRFFVHEVVSPKLGRDFWSRLYPWMGRVLGHPELGPGPAALLWHAQERFSFKGFEPFEPPPVGEAKLAMVYAGKGEAEAWVSELLGEPEGKLRVGDHALSRDLFTAAELHGFFEASRKGPPVTVQALGLRLGDAFPRAAGGQTLRPAGVSERFYVVRNAARWLKATRAQLEEHVRLGRRAESGKGRF